MSFKKIIQKIENGTMEYNINNLLSEVISFKNNKLEIEANIDGNELLKKLKDFNEVLFLYPNFNENENHFSASNLKVKKQDILNKK